MSEDLGVVQGKHGAHGAGLYVNSFFGGKDRGQCIQLTPSPSVDYVSLDRENVAALYEILEGWLRKREALCGYKDGSGVYCIGVKVQGNEYGYCKDHKEAT